VYEISGPLFFGAAQKAMAALEIVSRETKAVVILMDAVNVMDATGLVAFESALAELQSHKCHALICGVQPQTRTLLEKSGALHRQGVTLCENLKEALFKAEQATTAVLGSLATGKTHVPFQ